MTSLMQRLGLTVPIIQAPMAGVSTPALAAAVSNAGGLGSIAIGAMNAEAARVTIRETRALTERPFLVNVFCHAPASPDPARNARWLEYLAPEFARFHASPPTALHEIYRSFNKDEAMLAVLTEERPAVVSFHFGLPPPAFIEALREAGILLFATATTLQEAHTIAAANLDAVVAQGIEAGGHRGVFDPTAPDEGLGTLALTRLLVRETGLPVIAAGGIMDGTGVASVLTLGAQAAQLGTAFIGCPESAANAAYRAVLFGPTVKRTAITSAISGRPARGIVNRFTALGEAPERPPIPDYPVAYDAGKALHAAARASGSSDYAAHWAGQGVNMARALPAAELVKQLQQEAEAATSACRSV